MISFVIPAHNEARLLGRTLDALHAAVQALAMPWEIVVVDDASTDDTAMIAAARGARVLQVQCRHIAATRNAGAQTATGEWLAFVDADTQVDESVVRAAIDALAAGAVGGGAAVRLSDDAPRRARLAAAFFVRVFRWLRIAPGCFLFCTRTAFDATGGFDERYYAGEDVAMSRALARQGRFVILREAVATSARKLHTFTAREHLALVLRFAWRRRSLLTSREHLDLWYGQRRDERDRHPTRGP